MSGAVKALVADELAQPVDLRVTEMATALAALYPHAARAVFFYGSCLRESRFDDLMLDFYLIVSEYRAAYGKGWLARANRLIPPNVFPFTYEGMSAKYAVLSEADFARLCSERADNISVWARFAQPARLLWAADVTARERSIAAVSEAVPTLLRLALPGVAAEMRQDWRAVFEYGFSMTYRAELRAERKGRSTTIVDAEPERYRAMFEAVAADAAILPALPVDERARRMNRRRWRALQRRGKWLSVIRLAKASFTFADGIDYLAWKINRHAGTQIAITPWQRRHPLLAAFMLVPRLLRKKAIG